MSLVRLSLQCARSCTQFPVGYTILDNAILYKGNVYLVTDDKASLPPLKSIVETKGEGFADWQTLDKRDAVARLGEYGGMSVHVLYS